MRLVGLLAPPGGTADPSLLPRMLEDVRAAPTWSVRTESLGRCALGIASPGFPTLFAHRGLLAAFEGHIYDSEDDVRIASDAETLASHYRRHGFEGALRRIHGDFAAALYDKGLDLLWLARDRCGVHSLYYASTPSGLVFSSRPRPLWRLPGISCAPRRAFVALFAASHYRTIDHDPARSPFEDIAQLPAGHFLEAGAGLGRPHAYWSLTDLPDHPEPEDELARRYRDLLLDAVSRRLACARRPLFTLSGGMDSSSVLACAFKLTGARRPAISAIYEDPTYDESQEIRGMVGHAVDPWIAVRVGNPDLFDLAGEMIRHHDEPVATATWLSHYLVCREARDQGYDSLFGGLGGDELNAGEYEYFPYFFADLRRAGHEAQLAHEAELWIAYHDHPVFRKSRAVLEEALVRLVDLSTPGRCRPDHRRIRRYAAALNPDYFRLEDFEPVLDQVFSSYLKNRTYQDLFRETIPCCLRAEDRHTAAFGLDNFLPFLDHRLLEFMYRVPGTLKIRSGVTKHLLRRAMTGILPEETRTRVKKTGWNAPAHVWFTGPCREPLRDLIRSRTFRERGIYRAEEVDRILAEHDDIVASGRAQENHMMFLWQLVNVELWLQGLERA